MSLPGVLLVLRRELLGALLLFGQRDLKVKGWAAAHPGRRERERRQPDFERQVFFVTV